MNDFVLRFGATTVTDAKEHMRHLRKMRRWKRRAMKQGIAFHDYWSKRVFGPASASGTGSAVA